MYEPIYRNQAAAPSPNYDVCGTTATVAIHRVVPALPRRHVCYLPQNRHHYQSLWLLEVLQRGGSMNPIRELPRFSELNRRGRFIQPSGTSMDLNRHQFLFIGLMVLLVGLQFHYVSAYVLNPEATQFLAERTGQSTAEMSTLFAVTAGTGAAPRKVLQPPDWLAWCLMSVGAVLCLHSLAMPRPS